MCAPDVAYFGQKDYQQSLVIRRLVRDLDIPVRIEVCPTVREPDGLALSSRNAYLDTEQRERAASLSRALGAAAQAVAARRRPRAGPRRRARRAGRSRGRARVRGGAARRRPRRPAVAARRASRGRGRRQVGPARLIDNTLIELPSASERPPRRRRSPADRRTRRAPNHAETHAEVEDPPGDGDRRATCTTSGSITLDADLMSSADLLPGELVHVLDVDNGNRFETYVIEGEPGSGEVCLNGAAARLVHRATA